MAWILLDFSSPNKLDVTVLLDPQMRWALKMGQVSVWSFLDLPCAGFKSWSL